MAFGTLTLSDFLTLDGSFEFFISSSDAIALQLTPRETASLEFNVDAVGTTDDVEIQIVQGHRVKNGLGLDGASSATSLDLNTASDPITTDDDLNGTFLVMTSGGEQGEGRLITDSVATGDVVTLDHALSGTPSAAETYARYRGTTFRFIIDMSAAIAEDNTHSDGITVDARDGEFVLIAARATGATDAHRVRVSFQVDGVSI